MIPNILEYIQWRGDLGLEDSGFNEVDALILARVSYLPFELLQSNAVQGILLQEACQGLLMSPEIEKKLLWKLDKDLMELIVTSRRFEGIRVHDYVNEKNPEDQMQFSALCLDLPTGLRVTTFRGTDSTLLGWKEDFNMSFQETVPGQHRAARYLEEHADDQPLCVAGHSKGGNFAVYASAFCEESVQQQIRSVYNFDGPGFEESIIRTPGYQRILDRVHTIVPQSSIVGMLLEHEEDYTIIKSDQKVNFMQHDIYSWLVMQTRFQVLDSITNASRFIDHTLKDWVANMSVEQRETVIDSLYEVLSNTNASTIRQIMHNPIRYAPKIISSLKSLDEDSRKMITNSLKKLAKSAGHSLRRSEIRNDAPEIREIYSPSS